jgi:hypothetical protein
MTGLKEADGVTGTPMLKAARLLQLCGGVAKSVINPVSTCTQDSRHRVISATRGSIIERADDRRASGYAKRLVLALLWLRALAYLLVAA